MSLKRNNGKPMFGLKTWVQNHQVKQIRAKSPLAFEIGARIQLTSEISFKQ
jgi:hypothetical protein